MEKVTTLVAQLIKTKIPTALQKKIDKLTEVKNSINSLKPVNEADLTDELKIEIEELEQFAIELESPILEQLQVLVEEETKTPAPASPPKPIETPEPKKKNYFGIIVGVALTVLTLGVYLKNKE